MEGARDAGLYWHWTVHGRQAFQCSPGEGSLIFYQHQETDQVDETWCVQSGRDRLRPVKEDEVEDDYGFAFRSRPRGTGERREAGLVVSRFAVRSCAGL